MAVALGLGSPSGTHATVLVELSIEQLTKKADAIVIAKVIDLHTGKIARGGSSETITVATMRVSTWLKGQGVDRIEVATLGGRRGNSETVVPGAARYRLGQTVVAFLRHSSDGVRRTSDDTPRSGEGRFFTCGMAQGAFTVEEDAQVVHRDLTDVALVNRNADEPISSPPQGPPAHHQLAHGTRSKQPLTELLDEIGQALSTK